MERTNIPGPGGGLRGTARERTRLVVNPTSRRGRAGRLVAPVADILRGHGWEVDVVVTESAEHAREVAAGSSPDVLLVALGGDGLHGRVAEGAIASGCRFAPLPCGRGHDFVRALGGHSDALAAAVALPTARERQVDVGLAGGRVFLGVATIGHDSLATEFANRSPGLVPSSLVYIYGGAVALGRVKPHPIELRIDGRTHHLRGWNIAIGNSGRYGGGLRPNPAASMEDGLLDVSVVVGPRWSYPLRLPALVRGTFVDGQQVLGFRGREVEVLAPAPLEVYADGDPLASTPMRFTTSPGALRVVSALRG